MSEKSAMPFFHELPQDVVDKLIEDKKDVQFVLDNYRQPEWCTYPNALSMTFGCWSLCDLQKDGIRTKISHEFCKDCECYKTKTTQP